MRRRLPDLTPRPLLARAFARALLACALLICALLAATACDSDSAQQTQATTADTAPAADTEPTTDTDEATDTEPAPDTSAEDTEDAEDADVKPELPAYVRVHTVAGEMPAPDGKVWRRAIVHLHSTHSHDACDGTPRLEDGSYNLPCQAALRAALCKVRVDFAFLTDHRVLMARTPFLDLLQLDEGKGDRVIERGGRAVAGVLRCDDGFEVTTTVGMETELMPLDFQGHLDEDPATNEELLGGEDAAAAARWRVGGAMVWTAHTESKTLQNLREAAVDGVELYNLHANIDPRIRAEFLGLGSEDVLGAILPFATRRTKTHPDLGLLAFLGPNAPALRTWGVLLHERPVVATAGTDAHENVLPNITRDGERFDSYRRMMGWFSNYALADSTSLDDFEAALRAGRLFVGFDTLADPAGFDMALYDQSGLRIGEMGATIPWAQGAQIKGFVPAPAAGLPDAQPPIVRATLYRGTPEGDWVEVPLLVGANDAIIAPGQEVAWTLAEAGVYRVEVWMTPLHLKPYLDSSVPDLSAAAYPWIYTNAFRVLAP
jgi:hypothetical protein